MKNKFERLNKNEKKKAIEEFSNSNESNANIVSRIKRLKVIGIIGVIYSIGMFIYDIIKIGDDNGS